MYLYTKLNMQEHILHVVSLEFQKCRDFSHPHHAYPVPWKHQSILTTSFRHYNSQLLPSGLLSFCFPLTFEAYDVICYIFMSVTKRMQVSISLQVGLNLWQCVSGSRGPGDAIKLQQLFRSCRAWQQVRVKIVSHLLKQEIVKAFTMTQWGLN